MGSSSGNRAKTNFEKKKKRQENILLPPKADLCCYGYPPCCEESFSVIHLSSEHVQIPSLRALISRLRSSKDFKRLVYDKMKMKYIQTPREQQLSYRCLYPVFKTGINHHTTVLKDQTFPFVFPFFKSSEMKSNKNLHYGAC